MLILVGVHGNDKVLVGPVNDRRNAIISAFDLMAGGTFATEISAIFGVTLD